MLKITEKHGKYEEYSATYEIAIEKDGKAIAGFSAWSLSECPEDATLERGLSYAYDAISFFKLGYEAGKAAEQVEYVEEQEAE
jgi:hypothetical protein